MGRHARVYAMIVALGLASSSCGEAPESDREAWLGEPTSEWPDLVFTNDIAFADTTYAGIGNAFFVAHGADTLIATAKHIFGYLAETQGLSSIDLGPDFREWSLRSSRDPTFLLEEVQLLNSDATEAIGDYQSLKDRDWLLLRGRPPRAGHVFEIRADPVKRGEAVFAIGRTQADRAAVDPTVWQLRVFRIAGHHFYVEPEHTETDPAGSSGSPVVDRAGRLVGILSGASGRLGVVTSTTYLIAWADAFNGVESVSLRMLDMRGESSRRACAVHVLRGESAFGAHPLR